MGAATKRSRRVGAWTAAFGVVVAVAACGGSTTTVPSGPPGTPAPPPPSPGPNPGPTTASCTASTVLPVTPGPQIGAAKGSGALRFWQTDNVASPTVQGTVAFSTGPLPPVSTLTCYATVGPCSACDIPPPGDAPQYTSLDAGAVAFSGTSGVGAACFTYDDTPPATPCEDCGPFVPSYIESASGQPFAPGDTFVAQAAGADVPAFAITGTIPQRAVVTPVANGNDNGSCGPVDHTQDLPLAWTATGSGTLHVSLGTVPRTSGGAHLAPSLECDFPLTDGQGTIPAGAFALLEYPVIEDAFFDMYVETTTTQRVGAYDIRVSYDRDEFFCNMNLQ